MLKVYNIKDKIEYLREVAILEHNEWAKDPQESFEDRINKKGILQHPMYTDLMYGRTLFQISDTVIALNSPSKYLDEELITTSKRYCREYGGLPLYIRKNTQKIPLIYGHIIKGRDTGTGIVAWASILEHNELKEVEISIEE